MRKRKERKMRVRNERMKRYEGKEEIKSYRPSNVKFLDCRKVPKGGLPQMVPMGGRPQMVPKGGLPEMVPKRGYPCV